MWWPRLLTYGNWGGPGWSAGRFNDDPASTDWGVPAVDAMDALFKAHDFEYQNHLDRKLADKMLVDRLKRTNVKGVWSNIYRVGAIALFWIRGRLCS